MLSHLLTNFEIQKYYQNESRYNGVYYRDNLPDKIRNGAYVINLDQYSDIGTHWIVLCTLNNNVTYFDSSGIEHISKKIKTFIDKYIVATNIFKIQEYDLVMCGQFCIGFIDFKFKDKTFIDYTNLFSQNIFEKHDNIILNYFIFNV